MILRGIFAIELRAGFDELENYLQITEEYLHKAENDFENHVQEMAKKLSTADLSPREVNEIDEFYGEQHLEYAETFPRILRSSFFVSAYSLLESKLAIVCEWLRKDKKMPISWSDLRGGTLDQFRLYCELAGLGLSQNTQSWQEIQHYSMVRNCIVHHRGLIEGANREKELRAYASSKKIMDNLFVGVSIRLRAHIALTEEFCEEAIKTMWAFLSNVLKAYELHRQEQNAGG